MGVSESVDCSRCQRRRAKLSTTATSSPRAEKRMAVGQPRYPSPPRMSIRMEVGKLRGGVKGALLVLIPAYNEAQALPGVLQSMPQTVDGVPVAVIVVDDGSSDGTAEAAEANGAIALRHHANKGGG